MNRRTKTERRMASKDKEIEKLWADFADVPMNPETECMEADFLHFPTGTHREEIWRWFDEKHSKGVHFLLYGPEVQKIWKADVEACEATAILSALQDEGIKDPEEVRDLIHDYNALAQQYQALHKKHEEPATVLRIGGGTRAAYLCPDCRSQSRPGNAYCWNCGKRLVWRR